MPQDDNTKIQDTIDRLIRGAQTPAEQIARISGVPLATIYSRMRAIWWEEIRARRRETVLTSDEAAALGLCWPAIEREARRQRVLPAIRSALARIEAQLVLEEQGYPEDPSPFKDRAS